MSLKARILTDAQGHVIIQMEGHINVDNNISFRSSILNLGQQYHTSEFCLDMSAIEFVGASGLAHFAETLKMLKESRKKILKVRNLHHDFVGIFQLYGLTHEHILLEDFSMQNNETMTLGQDYAARKQTFEQ
jgi:anti-anti-sigma factor